jgi:hypothetical protein
MGNARKDLWDICAAQWGRGNNKIIINIIIKNPNMTGQCLS